MEQEKTELLNWLQDEYRQWKSTLDSIEPERMEQPGVAGDWSVKDLVAHLSGWNRYLVSRLRAVQSGQLEPTPPWPADLQEEDDINEWIYDSNAGKSLKDVLAEADQTLQELFSTVQAFPEELQIEQLHQRGRVFRFVWLQEHRLVPGEFFDHFHDDHEPNLRAWLAGDRESSRMRPPS
jgi:hypothetical protein